MRRRVKLGGWFAVGALHKGYPYLSYLEWYCGSLLCICLHGLPCKLNPAPPGPFRGFLHLPPPLALACAIFESRPIVHHPQMQAGASTRDIPGAWATEHSVHKCRHCAVSTCLQWVVQMRTLQAPGIFELVIGSWRTRPMSFHALGLRTIGPPFKA